MVNTMIGASIFGLPALIAARLGKWSPLGFLVAFAGISIIAACMAEVAFAMQNRRTQLSRSGVRVLRFDGLATRLPPCTPR